LPAAAIWREIMQDEVESRDRDERALWSRFSCGRSAPGAVCPDETALAAYVDGNAGAEERAAIEQHLCDCDRCRTVVTETRLVVDQPEELLPPGLARGAKLLVKDSATAAPARATGRVLRFPVRAVANWAAAAAACLAVSYCGYALGQRAAREREQIERRTVESILPGSVIREALT